MFRGPAQEDGACTEHYTSTEWSSDGTQRCRTGRFTVKLLQRAPVTWCPEPSNQAGSCRWLTHFGRCPQSSGLCCPFLFCKAQDTWATNLLQQGPGGKGTGVPGTGVSGIGCHQGPPRATPAAGCGTAGSLRGQDVFLLAPKSLPSESSSVSKRQVSFHLDGGLEDGPAPHSRNCLSVRQLPLRPGHLLPCDACSRRSTWLTCHTHASVTLGQEAAALLLPSPWRVSGCFYFTALSDGTWTSKGREKCLKIPPEWQPQF